MLSKSFLTLVAASLFAFTALPAAADDAGMREDIRKRRVVYRHRGHDVYAGSSMTRTTPGTHHGMANTIE